MKKTRILIAWLLAACPAAFAQTAYLENLKVENRQVEKQGRTVKVAMDVNLDALDMKTSTPCVWCPRWCRPTVHRNRHWSLLW